MVPERRLRYNHILMRKKLTPKHFPRLLRERLLRVRGGYEVESGEGIGVGVYRLRDRRSWGEIGGWGGREGRREHGREDDESRMEE